MMRRYACSNRSRRAHRGLVLEVLEKRSMLSTLAVRAFDQTALNRAAKDIARIYEADRSSDWLTLDQETPRRARNSFLATQMTSDAHSSVSRKAARRSDSRAAVRPLRLHPPHPISYGTTDSGSATIQPLYVSGGSGGSGAPPAPILTYSGGGTQNNPTFTDVVGDDFTVFLQPPANYTFATVTWSAPGSLSAQVLSSNTGFTNYPSPMDAFQNDIQYNGFWDQNPGSRTIEVTVTYNQGGGTSGSISGTVVQPTGNIVTTINGTPGIGTQQGAEALTTSVNFDAGTAGIDWTASVNPTSTTVSGVFGVIQTINPFTANRSYTSLFGTKYVEQQGVFVTNGTQSSPLPLLDNNSSATYYLYPGDDGSGGLRTFAPAQSVAYNSFTGNDTPYVLLGGGSWTNYTYNASYTMTLMYEPTGGIWVPLGTLTWTITMSAAWTSSSGWTATTSPTSAGGYSATTAYPTWDNLLTYVNTWVQTSP
jgi:hypothetical protein